MYMARGKEDVDELTDFFTIRGLLSPDTTLHCILTSAVASTSVIVDDAQSTGMRILKGMMDLEVGNTYTRCHPKRNHWQLVWRLR